MCKIMFEREKSHCEKKTKLQMCCEKIRINLTKPDLFTRGYSIFDFQKCCRKCLQNRPSHQNLARFVAEIFLMIDGLDHWSIKKHFRHITIAYSTARCPQIQQIFRRIQTIRLPVYHLGSYEQRVNVHSDW